MDSTTGLLELAPDPMLLADETGTIRDANEGVERLLNCDAPDLVGMDLADVVRTVGDADHGSLTDGWPADARRIGGDGSVFAECPDGRTVPVEVALAREERDGERYLVASLRSDSGSDRPTDSEERYRRLLEFSPAPIVIFDGDGILVYANQAAADLHGVASPAALIGQPGREFIHPDDRDDGADVVTTVVEEGTPLEGVERRLLTADGETLHVVFSGLPATFEGEPAGQIVLSDVTELKERERELERQNERLDRFASIVSHDLRSPLSVLGSSLELTEADDDHVERARRAVERMEELVDGLLAIARHGTTPVETVTVSIADAAWSAWGTVGTADADLVVAADAEVEADESRLRELLENLFRNAVTHGGEAVTVTLGETPTGFYVADDGPGIPAADREAVFESGFSTADRGTGLGLAIVDEIADAHGWTVTATESADGGARFEFDCS